MKAFLDADVLLHFGTWQADSLEKALSQLDYHLEDWLDSVFCDEFSLALGAMDSWNYRFLLYPEYKQIPTRVKGRKERPEWWPALKDNLAARHYTTVAESIEADDLLGHWATQDPDSVIITVDKDLNQIPGAHYDPKFKTINLITPDQANKFFLYQLVRGDDQDRIPGLPGMGKKKSEALHEEFKTKPTKEFAEKVIELYQTTYKEVWQDWFLSNGKLLWIQRKPNDWFTMKTFEEYFLAD